MKLLTIFTLTFLLITEYGSFQSSTSINGRWALAYFHDLTTNEKKVRPINYPPVMMAFTFSDSSNRNSTDGATSDNRFSDSPAEGTFEGHTTTNNVSGEYQLQGDKIKVLSFGGTKRGEYGWGSEFWTTIYRSSSFQLAGDTLRIFFNNDSSVMVFANKPKE